MANDKVEKKKGLFSSFASVFVESVETAPAAPAKEAQAAPSAGAGSYISSQPAQVDGDILKQIYKVLEENNLAGYDYFEFRAALENMKAVIPDEASRFKAAYAAVSSIVSASTLATSVEFYLGKLGEHKAAFEKFSEAMVKEKVTAKEEKAKSMEQSVADRMAQIAKINEDIAKLQTDKIALMTEAATERVKIEAIRANYMAASAKITGELDADRTKISSFLTK